MNEREAKEKVVKAGVRLVESGLIARTWGNVSCRISDSHFVITPSGRDYLSLTPEEIVTVAIADLSYSGTIKPSGEKAVHAEIYKYSRDAEFVIHTHQENASVVSSLGIESMNVGSGYPLLGGEVLIAAYGLPGTKKLRNAVAKAIAGSKSNAVIMKNHGAVCYGKNEEEAFQAASDLEKASKHFIEEEYKKKKHVKNYDEDIMRQLLTAQISKKWKEKGYDLNRPYWDSKRFEDGFVLFNKTAKPQVIKFNQIEKVLSKEAIIHKEVYLKNKSINYIIHTGTPNVLSLSHANITLFPLVDDFAQIIGTKVETVLKDPKKIALALKKASAVMIGNNGALCCGSTEGDAAAVQMIMEKNCKARIVGALFTTSKTKFGIKLIRNVKPLSPLDSKLMRVVYLKKYSKQISSNGK